MRRVVSAPTQALPNETVTHAHTHDSQEMTSFYSVNCVRRHCFPVPNRSDFMWRVLYHTSIGSIYTKSSAIHSEATTQASFGFLFSVAHANYEYFEADPWAMQMYSKISFECEIFDGERLRYMTRGVILGTGGATIRVCRRHSFTRSLLQC